MYNQVFISFERVYLMEDDDIFAYRIIVEDEHERITFTYSDKNKFNNYYNNIKTLLPKIKKISEDLWDNLKEKEHLVFIKNNNDINNIIELSKKEIGNIEEINNDDIDIEEDFYEKVFLNLDNW